MTVAALNILPSDQRHFGRYRLLCRLASGGMASLYLARFISVEGFEKDVAIKRIHEHLTEDAEFVQMFVDEARLAAQISHPNVAQIIELGSEPSYFIAMEYVHGESLTALVRRAAPPLVVSARIIAQAAAGLHAAHELRGQDGELLGVVHRDVSPHNILISYDGAVKVVDFGVARARGNLHQTSAGTVKGKFAYMSPEQARMEPVDRRSDIFALGIVLYEITTRYRLFKAPNEAATVTKVLHADIVPPSVLVADYPPTLERIVLKALSRDPSERYETAEDMQSALESFIIEQGSPLLQSAIGQLMRSTFPDRIAEKQAVLQSAETRGDISEEIDLGSNPSLTMGGATVSVAQHELLRRERRKRLILVLGLGMAAVVIFGGVGSFLFDVLAGDPIPPLLRDERAMRVSPQKSSKAVGALVRIEVHAKPLTAQISVDGREVKNPYLTEQKAQVGQSRVVISAEGYVEKTLMIPLTRGGFFSVELEKKAAASKPASLGTQPSLVSRSLGAKAEKSLTKVRKKKQTKSGRKTKRTSRKYRAKPKKNDELFGNPYGS